MIDVEKVAQLARLRLNPDEKEYFKEQFGCVLAYFGSISPVETDETVMERDESLQRVGHEDTVQKSVVSPEQFSDNIESGFFTVPRVIE